MNEDPGVPMPNFDDATPSFNGSSDEASRTVVFGDSEPELHHCHCKTEGVHTSRDKTGGCSATPSEAKY